MKTQSTGKKSLKAPERPPNATIFPFQLRHVSLHRLKLAELPPAGLRLIYDMTHPDHLPQQTS